MLTQPCLEINYTGILENYIAFSNIKANKNTKMAAVVKDNAYGLGAEKVTDILYNKGHCHTFFVAHAFEGEKIRPFAPLADIYVLQGPDKNNTDIFKVANLIPVINSPEQLMLWQQTKPNITKPAIQIETGLNRLGFQIDEIKSLSIDTRNSFGVVLSHLACADEPDNPLNQKQLDVFYEIKKLFPNAKYSLAASDGFLLGAEYQFDIVRLGAALYGINPFPNPIITSKNIIRVTAPIIQIKSIKSGDSIGYNSAYIAPKDGKIAIISIGYGDGVFRSFSPKGKVWFESPPCPLSAPVIGRISMDNLICDITQIPDDIINKNQYVTLVDSFYTIDDFGRDADTIGYESLSAIGHGIRYNRTEK